MMMNRKFVAAVTGEWWSVALRGVAALLAAVVILLSPIPRIDNLLRVFGAYMLADGMIDLVTAARVARSHHAWHGQLAQGLLGILVGLTNLVGGGLPALVRLDLIALRTFVLGMSRIVVAQRRRAEFPPTLPAWHLLLWGSVSVLFSVMLVLGPALQVHLVGELDWLACLYLVGFGVFLLTLAARLRGLSRVPPSAPARPATAR
jgi:uncharacterized membrane protein HdeD (DUF308 family)